MFESFGSFGNLSALNENKFFIGIMMILLNIGSRHLLDEFSENPEEYSRNVMLRRVAIFAVCFIATRDVVTSTILTAGYVILATGVSRRSPQEGMSNRVGGKSQPPDVENPAWDKDVKPLFQKSKTN
jgi:hypothetical protein